MRVPKYIKIENKLKQEIISGKFTSGDLFYSENKLKEKFNVSSITVVRALNDLVKEGYLIRRQGKGTFVSRSRIRKAMLFTDKEIFDRTVEDVKVLSIEKGNNSDILENMNKNLINEYYLIKRIRFAEGIPYMYQTSYIPTKYILNPDDKEYYKSIYTRFKQDFGLNLSEEKSEEINSILFPGPKKINELLKLPATAPVVYQQKKTHLSLSNETVEYVISYKRWDYFQIKMESQV